MGYDHFSLLAINLELSDIELLETDKLSKIK